MVLRLLSCVYWSHTDTCPWTIYRVAHRCVIAKFNATTLFPYLFRTYARTFISLTFSRSIYTPTHKLTNQTEENRTTTEKSSSSTNSNKLIINWMRFKLRKNIILGCFLYPIEPINKWRSWSNAKRKYFTLKPKTLDDHLQLQSTSLTTQQTHRINWLTRYT